MVPVATLESRTGTRTLVMFDGGRLEPLARQGKADVYIVATEDGLSPLGANLRFLSADLDVPIKEIKRHADWNRFENPKVTLVAIASRRKGSCLRGVILAASETSECYKRFAIPAYGRPFRDFYYNVTYEAVAYASEKWDARHLAISHLSGSGRFHEDIATCNGEALAHYCDTRPMVIDSFSFVGCCIAQEHLTGISRLNPEGKASVHRPITTQVEVRDGYCLVHLDWRRDA
jgi:hypothetical protein